MADEIDWTGFELTQAASEAPAVEWLGDDSSEEDLTAGYSLLRELADDPDSGVTRLANGVYYEPKLRPDRDKLS